MKKHFTQLMAIFALTISGIFGIQNHVNAQGFTVTDPTLTPSGNNTVIVWKVEQTTNNTGLSHFVIQNFCLPTGSNITVENSSDNENWNTIPSTTADGSTQACQTFGSFLKFSGSSNAKINYYRATLKGKYILVDGQSILKFGNGQGRNNDQSCIVVSTKVPKLASNIAETQIKQICEGGSINLQAASGFTNYVWKKDNASVSNNSNTYSITNAVPGTYQYQVTYQVSDCESFTEKFTVIVDAKPSISLSPASFCAGGSTNLSALISSEKKDGVWSIASGTGTISDGKLSSSTAGEVNLTYTISFGNGCTTSENVKVTVWALPTVTATANQTVCYDASVTLSGSGASTYTWDNGVTNGVSFQAKTTKTYTVTGTDANGCVNTATSTVTVNALPTVTATANQTVCYDASVTLAGSGASTYTWDNGVSNGVSFLAKTTKTYTVTGTDDNGCVNTATTLITVNALPIVTATANQTVCYDASVTLSGSGASTYTWDNGVTNGVSFQAKTTKTYTVTGTDGNGCVNTATSIVTVNALPTVTATANQTVCYDASVTLAGSGASTYTWDNGVSNGISFQAKTTKTYTVTGTDDNGCVNTATSTVTVNALPTVTATANQTVCYDASVTLSGSGASSYTWDNGVSNGISFLAKTTKTYTVTGTDDNGCVNTVTSIVTVNALPTVTATANQTVCYDASVTLVGSGASTYTWDNGISNGVAFLTKATKTYTVTGTDANGCVNTATSIVTVNALPIVTATANQTVCYDASVTLAGSGASAYTWDNGVSNGISFLAKTTKTYTVTGTDDNGCVNTATTLVTVNALPIVTATANQTVCYDASVTLAGSGASTYTWDNGVSNGVSFLAKTTKTYTVTGTDDNGCVNTATSIVTVNALPTVTATANQTVCYDASVTLAGSGASTYTWDNGVYNGVSFLAKTTKTYTVTGTDDNGCVNTATSIVTVNALPTVTATANQTVCYDASVTLAGSGASSYTWDNGVSNGVSFQAKTTKTYTVTGTDANGCVNTATSIVTVNALPTVTATADQTVCYDASVTLAGSGASTYTWDNGVTNGVSFQAKTTKTYTVTGTDANGCVNTATSIVTVNALPTVVANASATEVCDGTNVTLYGSGASSYTWSPVVTNNVAFKQNVGSVTYTVTGTDGNSCKNSNSITIKVKALPTVSLSPDKSICVGETATITASGNATSYLWTPGNQTSAEISVKPVTTTTYTVAGTLEGCTSNASTIITVKALPNILISGNNTICAGETVSLTATGATSIVWSTGGQQGNLLSISPTNTITYTATGTTDGCSASASFTVTVTDCAKFATYTQGYYGNVGGLACDGSTTKNKLLAAFSGVTSVTFGAAGGKSFTLYPTDITSDNIFKMLPGGGTPAALSPNKSIGWSYSKDYLGAKNSPLASTGKITNNLLSQTITLWINKQTSTGLAGFRMPSSFTTAKLICPTSNINYSDSKEFKVASKLVNKTVGQLLDLANSALAGTLGLNDPSLSDIFTTVDMINNAFDQGRVVISSQTTNSVEIKTMSRVVQEQTETIQSVQAYPNPFKGTLTFSMTPRYTGQASLDVYNVSGMKVATVFEGLLQAGEEQKIEFAIPEGQISQTFIFLFRQGNDVVQGKLVSL